MLKTPKFLQIKNLILFFQGFLFSLSADEEIRLEIARGSEIAHYAQDIVKISDAYYSQYPYLYDGTQCDEEFYLQLYSRWPNARLVMAFDGTQAVGYAIGTTMQDIPLGHEPLLAMDYSLDSLFLIGEIALLEPYRGKQIGKQMVQKMEHFAKEEIKCTSVCIMEIDETFVRMPKPDNYRPNDKFWLEMGYAPYQVPQLSFEIQWKNINESEVSGHIMYYRIKPLKFP